MNAHNQHYCIVQTGYGLIAVGSSREEALDGAYRELGYDHNACARLESTLCDDPYNPVVGSHYVARCEEAVRHLMDDGVDFSWRYDSMSRMIVLDDSAYRREG